MLIHNTYKTELSFGIDREIIISELEDYFEGQQIQEIFADEDMEPAEDSRSKANAVLRRLKESGWIEHEEQQNYRINIILCDYTLGLIEFLQNTIKNEEMEYQSVINHIYSAFTNKESWIKPYEYIIKSVFKNTEELNAGLKKLNTSIKKRIEAITADKTAGQIVEEFFIYHKEIGSKAYHRIKTSDNISHYRNSIIENLNKIMNDNEIFDKAVAGYIEIELPNIKAQNQKTQNKKEQDKKEQIHEAEQELRNKITTIISTFRNYDRIISEIDNKHSKYIQSAVARARFLLTNTSNMHGKISKILAYLAQEFNRDDTLNLNEQADQSILKVFNIFPQNFIDANSVYVVPVRSTMQDLQKIDFSNTISTIERERLQNELRLKNKNRFSKKNIQAYVAKLLKDRDSIAASQLPLKSKRDLIRIIFINLYSNKANYITTKLDKIAHINNFKFNDFLIKKLK